METVGTYEKEYKISFYIKHKVSDLEKTVMTEKWQWWELPDFP